jgi:mono/diheme cytochrome c family protein
MTKVSVLLFLMCTLVLGACAVGNASNGDAIHIPDIIVPGDPLAGATAYGNTCSTCHGRDLHGVEGLGGPLAPSDYVADTSEDDLVALIIIGRPRDHPDNTTGVAMLPRGGNPSLGDQSIHDISAYIRAHN